MKGAAPKPKLPLTDFFKPHELEVCLPSRSPTRPWHVLLQRRRPIHPPSCCMPPGGPGDTSRAPRQRRVRVPFTADVLRRGCQVLGDLSTRVRVVLDNTLPSTLHGTSSVEDGVPLAIINTQAPDKRSPARPGVRSCAALHPLRLRAS